MAHASLMMSGSAESRTETKRADLDAHVDALKDKARAFARLSVAEKARLLREVAPRVIDAADEWIAAACRAKGLDPQRPTSGEEWIAGPVTTVRNLRLLAESLESISSTGKPPLGRSARTRGDGRVEVDVFPASGQDKVMFAGFSCRCVMQPGLDEKTVRERQAGFYAKKDAEGGVSLVLGAGNVASIPPMDVFYKMFVDGNVCLLKMNPVNEYLGPVFEKALAPLIARGFLRVAYGAGDVGKYLVEHAGVDDIHITGSDRTHDLIVWGPPGEERERRKRDNDPILKKTITSELGNVSPVAIVPADYTDDELWFQARSVASMVANNGSFNCNAAKVLIVSEKWKQRDAFRKLVAKALSAAPLRKAYYPGARDRYDELTGGRAVEKIGRAGEGELPWTLIFGVDSQADDKLFQVEPFCGILSETALPDGDAQAFVAQAARFMNERMWGTLNACIVVHPRHEHDAAVGAELAKAVDALEYGTVAINHWPALGYGFVSPPWGGHPSSTLQDIQSGIGWVHNTFMLDGIEKSVVRGPLTASPKPAWFFDNKKTHVLGRKMVAFEASPSWLKVPALALTALGG